MKTYKIANWISTAFIAFIMTFTSYAYLSRAPEIMQELQKAGMPYYIFGFLGIAKLLGVIGLLISKWQVLTEWVYAGFTFLLLGAIWLHIATATSPAMAIFSFAVLIVSYRCRKKSTLLKPQISISRNVQ